MRHGHSNRTIIKTTELMENDILKCIETLKNGGTILYPTDTIWGIGCDATNEKAVKKVNALKNRKENKHYLISLDSPSELIFYLDELPPIALELINSYNKPLTIIYPKARNIAKNLIAPDGSIGIRVVKDEFCKELIHRFGSPIVSTSANLSGSPAPVSFPMIHESIVKNADYVVKYNQDRITGIKPSTIIKLTGKDEFVIIRE